MDRATDPVVESKPLDLTSFTNRIGQEAVRQYAKKQRARRRNKTARSSRKANRS